MQINMFKFVTALPEEMINLPSMQYRIQKCHLATHWKLMRKWSLSWLSTLYISSLSRKKKRFVWNDFLLQIWNLWISKTPRRKKKVVTWIMTANFLCCSKDKLQVCTKKKIYIYIITDKILMPTICSTRWPNMWYLFGSEILKSTPEFRHHPKR